MVANINTLVAIRAMITLVLGAADGVGLCQLYIAGKKQGLISIHTYMLLSGKLTTVAVARRRRDTKISRDILQQFSVLGGGTVHVRPPSPHSLI